MARQSSGATLRCVRSSSSVFMNFPLCRRKAAVHAPALRWASSIIYTERSRKFHDGEGVGLRGGSSYDHRFSLRAASNLRRGRKVCRASSHGVYMSNADEYDHFCRELASLAAKRLIGRTIDRAMIAAAFHEALLELRGADATTQRDERRPVQEEAGSVPVGMPSEVADILGWHADQDGKAIERFEKEARRIAIEHERFGESEISTETRR